MEVILYSKECNWYTRCCPLQIHVHAVTGGVCISNVIPED